jgi:hypothetical protein
MQYGDSEVMAATIKGIGMSRRLSLGISVVAASFVLAGQTAFAQIPSANTWRTAPLNYFARFHGFGYSDGYHSCKGNECEPRKSWLTGENMSSFYGEPTAPSPRSVRSKLPSYAPYQASQHYMNVSPQYDTEVSHGMSLSPMPMGEMMHPIPPSAPVPMAPTHLQLVPESTAPAASPSDVSPYDIPRPNALRSPESVLPQIQKPQTQRVVPGTHSLMMSQGGQPARR